VKSEVKTILTFPWRFALECADTSALLNDETCLVVGKRRQVAALQIGLRPFQLALAVVTVFYS
jgi:hypothetical protein